MSNARLILHVAAGFSAAVVATVFLLWVGGALDEAAVTLLAAVVSSQVGALAGWPLIERRLHSDWLAPLGTGLLMAVIVHVAMGLLWTVFMMPSGKSTTVPGDVLELALLITFYSVLFVGWITAPVAMIVAVCVNRLRRRERSAERSA